MNFQNLYPSGQKERGEWTELLFMATAARLGLKVARPHGDSARYDVIVEGAGRTGTHPTPARTWPLARRTENQLLVRRCHRYETRTHVGDRLRQIHLGTRPQ